MRDLGVEAGEAGEPRELLGGDDLVPLDHPRPVVAQRHVGHVGH